MAERFLTHPRLFEERSPGSSENPDVRANVQSEIDDCAGNTPHRHGGRMGLYGSRYYQPGGVVTPFTYPPSRDDYPSWPTYHDQGYIQSPDSSMQLQVTLNKIMDTQAQMKELIDGLTSRVTKLEHSFSSTSSACSSSPEGETKRIPTRLSKLVAQIHENLDENDQFFSNMKLKSEENQAVKKRISEEISLKGGSCYTLAETDRAIQRYFQSRQRIWQEENQDTERISKQTRSRKLRSRKVRLYNRRKKAVHEGEETERFNKISVHFMSDEESDQETESMIIHRPIWRSRVLTAFLEELDKRVLEKQQASKKHVPERKAREVGDHVNSRPPLEAPMWTVDSAWLEDHPDYQTA